jgi:hypothetical protein
MVAGYARADSVYEWSSKSCLAKTVGDASSPDLRVRVHGHMLAAGLAPESGQWVLIEARGDEEGELWLDKTFAFVGSTRIHLGALRNTRGSRQASMRRASTAGTT